MRRQILVWMAVSIVGGTLTAGEPKEIWRRHTIDDSSRGADGVRLGDVNSDGRLDLVTGWEQGGQIRVCINPGADRATEQWPSVTVGRVKSPEDAVFADLDGDGSLDVVSSCEGSEQTVFVHWAPKDKRRYLDESAWKTEPIPITQKKSRWMFALPMQIDGKHGIDLVIGSKNPNGVVGWLEAPENARDLSAWKWRPLCEATWIMSLIGHDMDGDGDRDIVFSDRKGPLRGCYWLENPGSKSQPTQSWKRHEIGGLGREMMFLQLVDLNNDGAMDALAAVRERELHCYHQTNSGWETATISLPETAGTSKGIAAGDLDGDGSLDLVASCERSGGKHGVMWFSRIRSSTSRWTMHPVSGIESGVKFDLVELLDLDGDGDLDILTCEEADNLGVIWYENPSRSPR